ncbi:MAG: class II fumarate hydratase [Novosphingobium sp.]
MQQPVTTDLAGMRSEKDALGTIAVPATAHWGAQTQRSLLHFAFAPQERMPQEIIRALAMIKAAAARVNRASLSPPIADAIGQAAGEIIAGDHAEQFPLTIWQTGSGTQSNMNVNEVIASRANEILTGQRGGKSPVHPNDHVNLHQSSNDSFPTALHIAAGLATTGRLLPALGGMIEQIDGLSGQWRSIVKIGRTHLQDATPLTLGQEFSAYSAQLQQCRQELEAALAGGIMEIAQGGTAVGTGINAPAGFAAAMADALASLSGLPLRPAPNSFAALAGEEPLVRLSGGMVTLATALTKLANDIRLLASGPRSGLGELHLPANEPGSSIMPGKVNPTQCEMLTMVCAQVIGNQQAIIVGAMQGQLQLNTFKPLIGAAVLRSIDLLATGMDAFTRFALNGLEPDRTRIAELVARSLMLVTALVPELGYDRAAAIARLAEDRNLTLREAALQQGVDAATFDRLVRPEMMI